MNTEIKKYANHVMFSDVEPYEVIEVITPKRVLVRPMKCTRVKSPSFEIGGFLAHFQNDEQEWMIEPDTDAETFEIRLHHNGWNRGRFHMNDKPVKYYDFNF